MQLIEENITPSLNKCIEAMNDKQSSRGVDLSFLNSTPPRGIPPQDILQQSMK
jgi:hypothetical protein